MKKLSFALCLFSILAITSCTENDRAKNFGGNLTIELPPDQKLVNATWKEADLWILTTEKTADDTLPNTYLFGEKSSWGIWEGSIRIIEHSQANITDPRFVMN